MKTLAEIREEINGGLPAEEGMRLLNEYIEANPRDDEALTARGMLNWSLGNRAATINDYLAAIKINPDSKAKSAIKATYEILNFYNKDLYNP